MGRGIAGSRVRGVAGSRVARLASSLPPPEARRFDVDETHFRDARRHDRLGGRRMVVDAAARTCGRARTAADAGTRAGHGDLSQHAHGAPGHLALGYFGSGAGSTPGSRLSSFRRARRTAAASHPRGRSRCRASVWHPPSTAATPPAEKVETRCRKPASARLGWTWRPVCTSDLPWEHERRAGSQIINTGRDGRQRPGLPPGSWPS